MITPEYSTNTTYSITVTCAIHPSSMADMCEVIATANGHTIRGEDIICMYICTYVHMYI